jgi:hypothetical protein
MKSGRLAVIGLPGTGKSTYIGALWHMVEEPSVQTVREAELPSDPRHVQQLAEQVRALQGLERTKHDDDDAYEAFVEFLGDGVAELHIPDRSGEQMQALVERRHWPQLLADELEQAAALLLFVHPDELSLPLGLHLASTASEGAQPADGPPAALGSAASASADEEGARAEDRAEAATSERAQYENKHACTAAQLVDGLENLLEAMEDSWPVKIAVVISAFDRVQDRTPREWLIQRLPALEAFLEHNPDRVGWTVFGVSAQGGRRQDAEQVLSRGDLHERAWARSADGKEVPLSEPIRWALGWR